MYKRKISDQEYLTIINTIEIEIQQVLMSKMETNYIHRIITGSLKRFDGNISGLQVLRGMIKRIHEKSDIDEYFTIMETIDNEIKRSTEEKKCLKISEIMLNNRKWLDGRICGLEKIKHIIADIYKINTMTISMY